MNKLASFAVIIKDSASMKDHVRVVSVSDIRVEGKYRNRGLPTLDGFVQFDWWATCQNGNIHVCTNYHPVSVVVKSKTDLLACLASVENLAKQEANTRVVSDVAKELHREGKQSEVVPLSKEYIVRDLVPSINPKQKRVLLVWNEIPYRARFFVIPDDHAMYANIQAANNKFINSTEMPDDHPIFALYEWIDGEGVMFERNSGFKARISEVYCCGIAD